MLVTRGGMSGRPRTSVLFVILSRKATLILTHPTTLHANLLVRNLGKSMFLRPGAYWRRRYPGMLREDFSMGALTFLYTGRR